MAYGDYYDDDGRDDDDDARRWPRILVGLLAVIALVGGVVWYVRSSDSNTRTTIPSATPSSGATTATTSSTAASNPISTSLTGLTTDSTPIGSTQAVLGRPAI